MFGLLFLNKLSAEVVQSGLVIFSVTDYQVFALMPKLETQAFLLTENAVENPSLCSTCVHLQSEFLLSLDREYENIKAPIYLLKERLNADKTNCKVA